MLENYRFASADAPLCPAPTWPTSVFNSKVVMNRDDEVVEEIIAE